MQYFVCHNILPFLGRDSRFGLSDCWEMHKEKWQIGSVVHNTNAIPDMIYFSLLPLEGAGERSLISFNRVICQKATKNNLPKCQAFFRFLTLEQKSHLSTLVVHPARDGLQTGATE